MDQGHHGHGINLDLLVDAALVTPAVSLYLDRLSGQLLPAAEVAARCGVSVAVQERYMRIPSVQPRLRLDDARDFAAAIAEGALRLRVERILRGPRAPWAFERELSRRSDLAASWRVWERACTTARILGWLGRSGILFAYPE